MYIYISYLWYQARHTVYAPMLGQTEIIKDLWKFCLRTNSTLSDAKTISLTVLQSDACGKKTFRLLRWCTYGSTELQLQLWVLKFLSLGTTTIALLTAKAIFITAAVLAVIAFLGRSWFVEDYTYFPSGKVIRVLSHYKWTSHWNYYYTCNCLFGTNSSYTLHIVLTIQENTIAPYLGGEYRIYRISVCIPIGMSCFYVFVSVINIFLPLSLQKK